MVVDRMKLRKAARIILVGAPGSGKGTQTERLLGEYKQLSAISSGDLLRDNVKNQTPLGIQAAKAIKAGNLVPNSTMLRLICYEFKKRGWLSSPIQPMTLASASSSSSSHEFTQFLELPHDSTPIAPPSFSLHSSGSSSPSFILDGFPRTVIQALQLEDFLPVNLVISLKVPFEVIMERIAGRWVHAPSGRVYNTTFNKPIVAGVDDATGEALTKRADDDEVTWKTRLKNFEQTSEPLLEHYARKGILWEIEGRSSDEITPKLFREVEDRFGILD